MFFAHPFLAIEYVASRERAEKLKAERANETPEQKVRREKEYYRPRSLSRYLATFAIPISPPRSIKSRGRKLSKSVFCVVTKE